MSHYLILAFLSILDLLLLLRFAVSLLGSWAFWPLFKNGETFKSYGFLALISLAPLRFYCCRQSRAFRLLLFGLLRCRHLDLVFSLF